MLDSELHDDLPEKEIRDFLSKTIRDLIFERDTLQRKRYPNSFDYLQNAIENCKSEIEYNKKYLNLTENLKAVFILLKSKGWNEYDLSDHVTPTSGKYYLHFIGTIEEVKTFCKEKFNILYKE